jgi:flagellar biogenesis protein FliO
MRSMRTTSGPSAADRGLQHPAQSALLRCGAVLLAALFGLAGTSWGQTGSTASTTAPSASPAASASGPLGGLGLVPDAGGLVLKLALCLIMVVGLILLLQRRARRYGSALGTGGGADGIRIVTQRTMGPRLSLAVVQVMGRTLLVGVSPQGIQPVADLDGREERLGSGFALERAPQMTRLPADSLTALPTPPGRVVPGHALPKKSIRLWPFGGRARKSKGNAPEIPPAPACFESEMARKLTSLRERYQAIGDLEAGLDGGNS